MEPILVRNANQVHENPNHVFRRKIIPYRSSGRIDTGVLHGIARRSHWDHYRVVKRKSKTSKENPCIFLHVPIYSLVVKLPPPGIVGNAALPGGIIIEGPMVEGGTPP